MAAWYFSRSLALPISALLLSAGCSRTGKAAPQDRARGTHEGPGTLGTHEQRDAPDHDCSQPEAPQGHSSSKPAGALGPGDRDELSTIRVSAHVGSVTLRKRDGVWVTAGGCAVPPTRVNRAVDALVELVLTPAGQPIRVGTPFELQIDAFAGERHLVHLEIADRNAEGDLARLRDDSTVRLRGLDRTLWVADPNAWCREP